MLSIHNNKQILFEIKQRYGLNVPPDYEQQFIEADKTFLYQRVFDPIKNQLVTLNPVPEDLNLEDMEYIGPYPFSYLYNTIMDLTILFYIKFYSL